MTTVHASDNRSLHLHSVSLCVLFSISLISGVARAQTSSETTKPPSMVQPKKPASLPTKKEVASVSQKVEVVNNEAVLKMVQADLDDALVIAKIQSAPNADFHLDIDSIVELKNKKVSASVIRAMMEKAGMPVADLKPADPPKPTPAPLGATTAIGGTWSGQMTIENEPTTIRLVFQRSALGTYSGGIVIQASSGVASTGRVEVREGEGEIVLAAVVDAGAQVEFTPSSLSATSIAGDVQAKSAGSNGVRKGTFSITK